MIGLVIGGLASGVGKTTLTLGLIGALRRRGLTVQPFKVGPDYIDPSQHTQAAGLPSRNLDSWLLSRDALRELFWRAATRADAAIVEGVMGLFDGRTGAGEIGSTAQVAKLLRLPTLLVVDAARAGRSVAATVLGCQAMDPDLRIVGVVLNNVASARHAEIGRAAIESMTGLPVLGWLPRDPVLRQEERYLGLVPAAERRLPPELLGRVTARVEEQVDLDRLWRLAEVPVPPVEWPSPPAPLSLARERGSQSGSAGWFRGARERGSPADRSGRVGAAGGMPSPAAGSGGGPSRPDTLTTAAPAGLGLFPAEPVGRRARIAVAQDAAFSFYYQDSLDLLTAWGAELLPFSPLQDAALPVGAQAVYLGGGFPELFAAELAANTSMLAALNAAAAAGLPIYAECGGLMYLQQSLTDRDGRAHQMAGIIPGSSTLAAARLSLGYRELRARRDTFLLRQDEPARGHEFHWSVSEAPPDDLAAYDVDGASGRVEGYAVGNVVASYVHLHFGSDARLAPRFVEAAAQQAPLAPGRETALAPGRETALTPRPPRPCAGEGEPDCDTAGSLRDSPSAPHVIPSTSSGQALRRHQDPMPSDPPKDLTGTQSDGGEVLRLRSQARWCEKTSSERSVFSSRVVPAGHEDCPENRPKGGRLHPPGVRRQAHDGSAQNDMESVEAGSAQGDRQLPSGRPHSRTRERGAGGEGRPPVAEGDGPLAAGEDHRSHLQRHGLPPADIEALSRQRIEDRLGDRLPPDEPARSLVARLVYAAGDPDLTDRVVIRHDGIKAVLAALRAGAPVVVDVGMVAAGVGRPALERLGGALKIAISGEGVADHAARLGITRSAAGILVLADRLDGAVVAIGNAPTALLALLDLVAGGTARPAAVIGMPVGFVAAEESKELLLATNLPCIVVRGTRGGSALAAAAVNHLVTLASDRAAPAALFP